MSFYTSSSSGDLVSDWLDDAAELAGNKTVATGVYYCCGDFSVTDDGVGLRYLSDSKMESLVNPLKRKGLKVHFCMTVSNTAIMNQTWKANTTEAFSALASSATQFGFDGFIVDYEPSKDYTSEHEELYADFLTGLSDAMHAVGKESGFCSAGWGILAAWEYYRKTNVDIATSMTPTYNWLGNGEVLYDFVKGEINNKTGMPHSTIGTGIGTTLSSGYKPEWQYNWTQSTLQTFVGWLKNETPVKRLDFWRADIDHNWPAKATVPWLFEVAADFLQ